MFCDILLLDGARSTQFTSSDDLTEVSSSVMNQYLCEILEGSYGRLGWFPGDVLKLVSSKQEIGTMETFTITVRQTKYICSKHQAALLVEQTILLQVK